MDDREAACLALTVGLCNLMATISDAKQNCFN